MAMHLKSVAIRLPFPSRCFIGVSWLEVVYTSLIYMTFRSHFYHSAFTEVSKAGVVGTLPSRSESQERKSSLNTKFLGGISREPPADIRSDVLAPKLSPHRSERRKIKLFARTPSRGDLRNTLCRKTSGC